MRSLVIAAAGAKVQFRYREFDGVENARHYDIDSVSVTIARERLALLQQAIEKAEIAERDAETARFKMLAAEIANKQRELDALRARLGLPAGAMIKGDAQCNTN